MDKLHTHTSTTVDYLCLGCSKYFYEERLKFIMMRAVDGDKRAIKVLKRIEMFQPEPITREDEDRFSHREIVFYVLLLLGSFLFMAAKLFGWGI